MKNGGNVETVRAWLENMLGEDACRNVMAAKGGSITLVLSEDAAKLFDLQQRLTLRPNVLMKRVSAAVSRYLPIERISAELSALVMKKIGCGCQVAVEDHLKQRIKLIVDKTVANSHQIPVYYVGSVEDVKCSFGNALEGAAAKRGVPIRGRSRRIAVTA